MREKTAAASMARKKLERAIRKPFVRATKPTVIESAIAIALNKRDIIISISINDKLKISSFKSILSFVKNGHSKFTIIIRP